MQPSHDVDFLEIFRNVWYVHMSTLLKDGLFLLLIAPSIVLTGATPDAGSALIQPNISLSDSDQNREPNVDLPVSVCLFY